MSEIDQTYEESDCTGCNGPAKCAKCHRDTIQMELYKTDYSGEDVAGWRYKCPCGQRILVIND